MKKRLLFTSTLVIAAFAAVVLIKSNYSHEKMLISVMVEALTDGESDSYSCEREKKYSETGSTDSQEQFFAHESDYFDICMTIITRRCYASGEGTLRGDNANLAMPGNIGIEAHNENRCGVKVEK